MLSVFDYFSYRDYLQAGFAARLSKNPSYSLRAFARDLGLSPSQLSQVLSGAYGLSLVAAGRVGKALELTTEEQKYLNDLVTMLHGRGFQQRENARKRATGACRSLRREIDLDSFLNISDWCHLALRELCVLPDFSDDPAWMASRLNLDENTIREAWERLLRMGLVSQSAQGDWLPQPYFATPTDQAHVAGKIFHRQMIEKAREALEMQPLLERDFSGLVLAFASEQMPEAKRLIRDFRRSFEPLLKEQRSSQPDSVYGLTIQLFRLDS
ncbi:MAG: TIGR02147 family protein, partial [Bdellovibrionota bacterium]